MNSFSQMAGHSLLLLLIVSPSIQQASSHSVEPETGVASIARKAWGYDPGSILRRDEIRQQLIGLQVGKKVVAADFRIYEATASGYEIDRGGKLLAHTTAHGEKSLFVAVRQSSEYPILASDQHSCESFNNFVQHLGGLAISDKTRAAEEAQLILAAVYPNRAYVSSLAAWQRVNTVIVRNKGPRQGQVEFRRWSQRAGPPPSLDASVERSTEGYTVSAYYVIESGQDHPRIEQMKLSIRADGTCVIAPPTAARD